MPWVEVTVKAKYEIDPDSDSYNEGRPLSVEECFEIDLENLRSGNLPIGELLEYVPSVEIDGKVLDD